MSIHASWTFFAHGSSSMATLKPWKIFATWFSFFRFASRRESLQGRGRLEAPARKKLRTVAESRADENITVRLFRLVQIPQICGAFYGPFEFQVSVHERDGTRFAVPTRIPRWVAIFVVMDHYQNFTNMRKGKRLWYDFLSWLLLSELGWECS